MPAVELRGFEAERDLPQIAAWLRRPHVARWWGDPETVLAEVRAHPPDAAALIVADANPVGYLQWQTPTRAELEEAGLADLPEDLVDIDIMIGEPDSLGRGIGPEALRLLFTSLRSRGVRLVGVAAEVANPRALAAYAKAGLRPYRDFVERGEQYRYYTRDLDAADQPAAPP